MKDNLDFFISCSSKNEKNKKLFNYFIPIGVSTQFSGTYCQYLTCSGAADPASCTGLNTLCYIDAISAYCPVTCLRCTTTTSTTSTTSTSTTTACPTILTCQNSGTQDPTTCLCVCK